MSEITKIIAFEHFRGLPCKNDFGKINKYYHGRYDYIYGYHIKREGASYIFNGVSEIRVQKETVNLCIYNGLVGDEDKDIDLPIFVEDAVLLTNYHGKNAKSKLDCPETWDVVVGYVTIFDYSPVFYIGWGEIEHDECITEDIQTLCESEPISLGHVDNSVPLSAINQYLCKIANKKI